MTIETNNSEFNISLFDYNGKRLKETTAHGMVEWVLNGYGPGQFYLAFDDPSFEEEYIRFGNFALLSHTTAGLWGGVLLGARGWRRGKVVINMLGCAYQFSRRRGPPSITWTGSAGSIYRKIFQWGNAQGDMNVQEGEVFQGGTQGRQETSKHALLSKSIERIQGRSGNDWQLRPELNSKGELVFYADWYQRLGIDTTFFLTEGVNIELKKDEDIMVETPDIINDDVVFSLTAANNQPAVFDRYFDAESIDLYGLTQFSEGDPSKVKTELKDKAKARVLAKKRARREYKGITALDVGDTWLVAREGNSVVLNLPGVGFRSESSLPLAGDGKTGTAARVRIKRRRLDTLAGRMTLTPEEVYSD